MGVDKTWTRGARGHTRGREGEGRAEARVRRDGGEEAFPSRSPGGRPAGAGTETPPRGGGISTIDTPHTYTSSTVRVDEARGEPTPAVG